MIFENAAELKERVEALSGRRIYGTVNIVEDTSNYMGIMFGDVLRLEGNDYFVLGDTTEGRFGIAEQPKFWVKHAIDLDDGSPKILKLVFFEQFKAKLGFFTIHCSRSPDKESRVLELVADDPRFMQGRTVHDGVGNNIRVIDRIKGKSLYNYIADLEIPHEAYYYEVMPELLRKVVSCIDAIDLLNRNGTMHGDIRNDHILIESGTGRFRWIDFDYVVNFEDFDVWSLGNVLNYVVGQGLCSRQDALEEGLVRAEDLSPDDSLMFFSYRLANVRKLYPYVSKELNEILMRFSAGTEHFCDDCGKLARDVASCL